MELVTSRLVARYFEERLKDSEVEEFWVAALKPSCEVIKVAMLFRGTIDKCFIHPRDIFRFALLNNATFLVVAHNHPSGRCNPSDADKALTKRLKNLGEMLQISLLDHVILSQGEYFSFAESRQGPLR